MPASAGYLVNSRVKSRELGRVQWGGYELINNPLQLPHGLMYHSHNILTVNEENIGAIHISVSKLDELDEGRHPYQEKEPLKPFPDNTNPATGEVGGPKGPEPTRYGDWERKGRVSDF
uniref:Succinate dehydrogenase assembly factor 4, mitochondrial n=1 Tax=Timema shepardi TaxID=629360 RepID=A0A7R9AXQ8_TIMSH|nr:unnamed protein product [Timema shepardi]